MIIYFVNSFAFLIFFGAGRQQPILLFCVGIPSFPLFRLPKTTGILMILDHFLLLIGQYYKYLNEHKIEDVKLCTIFKTGFFQTKQFRVHCLSTQILSRVFIQSCQKQDEVVIVHSENVKIGMLNWSTVTQVSNITCGPPVNCTLSSVNAKCCWFTCTF